jgi:4-amino-4-deoxy-L-arabinose transferase-like glycosyltransferase
MPPTPQPDDDRAPRCRAMLILLGITLAGGLLRFALLGQPCLWGDEALVYWRTCGSYADLLQPLHSDGFPPLHYELFWVIIRALGRAPGPAAMRAVAATCGTLLVPAVYFLARQLLPRRASLVAAAFTAGSAFALFYSRDAKMYAEAWLAMTLGVGCLLWWLRTGRSTAWLAWVAAGAAAGGLQTLTLVSVVGLSPLFLLTQRRAHWRQTLAWLAGVALIAAGPVGYYARFNAWTEKVDDRGWRASGLEWVPAYNFGRTGPQQVRYLATTFLTGWEWPRPIAFTRMPPRRGWLLCGAGTAVVLLVAAGALPWRTLGAVVAHRRPAGEGDLDQPQSLDVRARQERGPEPPWRVALWLTAWIALPVYGFYCRSVPDFATPEDALAAVGLTRHVWPWVAVAIVAAACVIHRPTRTTAARWLGLALVLAGVTGACQATGMVMASLARAAAAEGHPWESVWVPRYMGFVWPAVAVAAAALLDRLPTRAVRASALAVVLAGNLGMFAFRLFGTTEPPVDRMAADVWAAQPAGGHPSDTLTWTDLGAISGGNGGGHLFSDPGRYYLELLARRPMSPTLFKGSLSTFTIHRWDPDHGVRAAVATAGPSLRRVVVWDQSDVTDPPPDDEGLLPRLPGWRRSADEAYTVRDVWTGQDLTRYRRREYLREPRPSHP